MLSILRRKLDSWPLILIFGAIYVVSQTTILVIVHPLGIEALQFQLTLSADRVREILAHWDSTGLRSVYVAHFRYDNWHPLWYSMALATQIAKGLTLTRASERRNLLLLLPFIAGLCDELENYMHLRFLADSENITDASVLLSGMSTNLKWLLSGVSIAAAVTLSRHARSEGERAGGAAA